MHSYHSSSASVPVFHLTTFTTHTTFSRLTPHVSRSTFLATFFTFCKTSSFSQGTGLSVQRWGWKVNMIWSGRRPELAAVMMSEVL